MLRSCEHWMALAGVNQVLMSPKYKGVLEICMSKQRTSDLNLKYGKFKVVKEVFLF